VAGLRLDLHMPRLLRNIVANYAGSIASVAILFFLTPFVIHRLGDEAYAVWVLIQSISFYLCFYDLGIYDAIVKYTAEFDEEPDDAALERVVGTALVVCAAAGAAAVLTSVGLAWWLVPHLDLSPELVPTVQLVTLILAVDIAVDFMAAVLCALLEGRQRYDVLNGVQVGVRVGQALATVVLLVMGYGLLSLAVLELAMSIAFLAAMIVCTRVLDPELALTLRRFDRETWRRMRGYSFWSLLSEIAAEGSSELDKLFIPTFLSLALLTPYSIACSVLTIISWVVHPIVTAFFPFSAALGARDDREGLDRLLIQGSKATLAMSLPVAILLLLAAESVIENWVGAEYVAEAAPVLRIVLVNVMISAAFAPAVQILAALDKVREIFWLTLIEILVSVAMVSVTAGSGGLPGLTASLLAANFLIDFGLLMPLACRTLGVPVGRFLREVIAAPLAAALPAAGLAVLLSRYAYPETWLALGLQGIAIGLLYALTFLAICVSKRERELIFQYASRLLVAGAR